MKEVRIDGKRYNINTAEFIASWDNDLRIMSLCVSIIHVQYTYIFNTLFFHKFFLFLRSSGMMPRYFFFLCAYQYHPRPHISPLGLALECAGVCGRVLAGQYWRGRVLYV